MTNYICLCSQIREKKFINFIDKNFSLSLEEVYAEMNIGNKCSACRLKLEIIYIKQKNNFTKRRNVNTKQFLRFKNKFSNYTAFLNNFFAFKPVVQNLVAPIFNGGNVSTNLIVSNKIPDTFLKYAANFVVVILIRDKEGNIIKNSSCKLKKNTRLVFPLNIQKESELNSINSAGSVWVKIKATSKGYIGFTRPHIRISDDNFISSIHLQNGKKDGVFINSVFKKNENQYLSLVNMETSQSSIEINLNNDNNTSYKKILNPYESILLDINKIFKGKFNNENNDINILHDGILRRNFLIENIVSKRISIDHI